MTADKTTTHGSGDIAIVGLSVAVPGANSAATYWDNLKNGIGSIETLDKEILAASGERAALLADPNYVPAAARLDGFDTFDADFFGFSPKEAAILDPQHRKFLEVAWEAMEQAGHPPESLGGRVGVYAGCGMGSYFYFNICSNPDMVDDVGMFLLRHTGNDKDFLTTRVSHVFDLQGPSVNVQTACSTSLVAVHYACKALSDGECDMALAGGVTIELPQNRGYLYKENEILSPDGQCHAFDHRAQGTVFGSGAGAVALRRLEDAVADGDHIWAVIKGSAINNDGADKAGYLAPSVGGQVKAVQAALKAADITPDTIDHVECHGTGTYLGDPIEISALTDAYRATTSDVGYCKVGSVKTNIGHLDTAAGIAGLAKTALALKHKALPPSLGYESPNPAIDFETSPFKVNDRLQPWISHKGPRRGAVNALGVGGTNAHAILEEAPDRSPFEESDFPFHVLCLSGQSKAALEANTTALATHLRQNPDLDLADVAFTLKEGRRGFAKRRVVVAETAVEAAAALKGLNPREVFTHDHLGPNPDVVFMFPGGGAQYAGMAQDLYETEPVFAEWMDRGLNHLQPQLDYDIRALWLPEDGGAEAANKALQKPSAQLPLIMIVEYALAQLWMSWGVKPAALVGHSMGENTAACLAGVLSFEDCIDLVLLRGRLFDKMPAGGMLSISLSLTEVEALIGDDLDIASVNAPGLTAVSGPQAALDALSKVLTTQEIDHQRINIDIAAHSRMLDVILEEYGTFLRRLDLQAPNLPIQSNRTGAVLRDTEATDPDYWVAQLRNTVLFADCIEALSSTKGRVYLEVGPGKALSSLAQMASSVKSGQVLSSLRHPDQDIMDDSYFFGVIGRLWACGVEADWSQIWGEAKRHRLPLPTYAFQRSRYFIEPGDQKDRPEDTLPARHEDIADWGYRPSWRPALADCEIDIATELGDAEHTWLIFEDDLGHANAVTQRLRAAGHPVITVQPGDTYAQISENQFILAPEQGRFGYDALFADLAEAGCLPDRIAHFWLVTDAETFRPGSSFFDRNLEMGFYGLTALGQALGNVELSHPVHLSVFTTGAAQTRDEPLLYPEKSMISGPLGVMPRELPDVTCSQIDIELPAAPAVWQILRGERSDEITERLLEELCAETPAARAVWRGAQRFEQGWRARPLPKDIAPQFKEQGTYLITGGFGGIGLTLAAHLMETYNANVVLVSRDGLPLEENWDAYLASHGQANRTAQRIKAMRALEAIGKGTVVQYAADVCNIGQMRNVKASVEARFGKLTGLIHSAGHIDDAPLLAKTEEQMAQVLAPKVNGLRVLDDLFEDGSLELLLLCSSSSTATHPAGQADYIAANDYLNAWAQSRSNNSTRVMAIDWGIWSDVGMASDAMAARLGTQSPAALETCDMALLDERGFDALGNRYYRTTFSGTDWIIDEHRTRSGVALLPGTGMITLISEALHDFGIETGFSLSDLYFLRAFVVPEGESRELILRFEDAANGYAVGLFGKASDGYQRIAEAQITLNIPNTPKPVDLAEVSTRCPVVQAPVAGRLTSPQEAHLAFGPRWHVLTHCARGTEEGLARLALAQTAKEDVCLLHPGLMDLATGWALDLVPGYNTKSLWVPVSYGDIRVFGPLEAEICSHMRLVDSQEGEFAQFDISLCAADGRVLVEIETFQMKRLAEGFALAQDASADTTAAEIGLAEPGHVPPLSADEQRLQYNLQNGIRATEGPEALERALATGRAQVLVSSLDLEAMIVQAGQSTHTESKQQSFERPQLDAAFVAPRTPVEEVLAELFSSLLGVSQIGVDDSFFDLGGHSLVAVRLFAQIKRRLDVEFPMSVLFEAPTVAALAKKIEAHGPKPALQDAGTDQTATQEEEAHKHLVLLHPGNGRGTTPFFLVAGMFGNVLNLRHLALLLGKDRPIYGIQAKGLIGEDTPHDSLTEAATDYLAEIQQVQPEGPYLLGGFSGGGLTAYEMAQQLEAQGDKTAALILLDTPLPLRPELTKQDKALIKLQEIRSKGPTYFAQWARNRIVWEIEKRRNKPAETGEKPAFNNRKIELAFRAALESYELRPWNGSMTLLRPPLDHHWKVSGGQWISQAREYVFADNDWTRWAPNVEVIEVPGNHDSMVLVPNVSVLASEVKHILDHAEQPIEDHSQTATAAE